MAHDNPPTDQTEPAFTTMLHTIIAAFAAERAIEGGTPHITRMEDNRILWQTGKLSMSITVNDVSREYQ